ncbi:Spry Domain-Containing Protein 7 [Manis pentadactyla]|nr:Spry Domain-Containing Protein 7 [Manis pentadactyla]
MSRVTVEATVRCSRSAGGGAAPAPTGPAVPESTRQTQQDAKGVPLPGLETSSSLQWGARGPATRRKSAKVRRTGQGRSFSSSAPETSAH